MKPERGTRFWDHDSDPDDQAEWPTVKAVVSEDNGIFEVTVEGQEDEDTTFIKLTDGLWEET